MENSESRPKTYDPANSARDYSIAKRLTFSLILTVSFVSVIAVGLIYYREVQKTRMALKEKADEIVAYQVGALAIPLWDLDERSIKAIGKTISQNELIESLEIKDYFDRIAFSVKRSSTSDTISRSSQICHQGRYVGEVRISLSKSLHSKNNRKLLLSFLLTIFLIIITLVFTSGILVRTLLRKPLGLLNEMVKAYSSGQYNSYNLHQPYIEFKPFSRVLKQMGNQITEQLSELKRAEKKYRSIFENAIEGIFQSTPEGRFLNVNPAMAEIMGYNSPAEMIANVDDIARQFYAEPEERRRFLELVGEKGRVLEFETRLLRKDKEQIIASISAQAITGERGDILYYEGYLVDISHRKQAAEALRRAKEQLALLLESLPIVPFTCKPEGDYGITYVSRAIEEITGFKPKQFTSNSAFWADHLFEEDRVKIISALPSLMEMGRTRYEYRFATSDGTFRWFDDTRRLVYGSDGQISHIAGTWRDITEEKRLRKEADYRMQQVIQADKLSSLGEVVAGVAHEINNPNHFITANLPILEETWNIFEPILAEYAEENPQWRHRDFKMDELCEDMNEIIQALRVGSDRINRIISGLKDFVRLENGYQPVPVDVNTVIEKTFAIVGGQVRKSVGRIEMDLGSDMPTVTGNFQKLEQVVANLIVNALHAIPDKGKGYLKIATRYSEKLGAVTIQVEDNGEGMTPNVIERIFEPFFTLKREKGGTGLGLSVTYNLVKEHGGHIGVLSRPGKGSRFTIFLPIKKDIVLELRPSILCVDDDPRFLNLIQSYFVETGDMQVFTATTPDEMLTIIDERPEIDTILADLKVLHADRDNAFKQIKRRFPLLGLIVYSADITQIQSLPDDTGIVHYLPKPFKIVQLKKILNEIGRQKL